MSWMALTMIGFLQLNVFLIAKPLLFPSRVIFPPWPNMFLRNVVNKRHWLYESAYHWQLSHHVKIRRYKYTHGYHHDGTSAFLCWYEWNGLAGAGQLKSCTGSMSVLAWFLWLVTLSKVNHFTKCTEYFYVTPVWVLFVASAPKNPQDKVLSVVLRCRGHACM